MLSYIHCIESRYFCDLELLLNSKVIFQLIFTLITDSGYFNNLFRKGEVFLIFNMLSGRKFNKHGELKKQWWTDKSLSAFKKRSKCMQGQYSKYKVRGKYPVS